METIAFAITAILLFSFFMPLFEEWINEKERRWKE
jgi:F0F1-type ATP synthase membrane subunit b/b'